MDIKYIKVKSPLRSLLALLKFLKIQNVIVYNEFYFIGYSYSYAFDDQNPPNQQVPYLKKFLLLCLGC